jgi:hypothetical protein
MRARLVIAVVASISLVVVAFQLAAPASPDDPLPCRPSARAGLKAVVADHVNGGRDRICQVGADTAVATVTKRAQDDSIAAVRHVLMVQKQQSWTVTRDVHLQKCQPGRGHRSFSREPCV